MLEWIKDIGVIVASLIAAVFLFLPQLRRHRPLLTAVIGLSLAIGVTGFEYYLKATSGRGLQDRAACLLFPNGEACQVDSNSVRAAATTGADNFIITEEMLSLPDGTWSDAFDSDVESKTYSGILSPPSYCGEFTIRNIGTQSVALNVGPRNSDSISSLVGIGPGERHRVDSLPVGEWVIFDVRRRFYFVVNHKCR